MKLFVVTLAIKFIFWLRFPKHIPGSTDESEEMFIGAINNEGKASQWNANITINGKITSFKIDTGLNVM